MKRAIVCFLLLWAALSLSVTAETLRSGTLNIQYSEGQEEVARDALAILDEALGWYAERLPAGDRPIRVILCATPAEYRRYAGRYARHNIGGVAKSSQGVIIIKTPRLQSEGVSFAGVLRHELVHVLLARNVNTAAMPRWLNEGMAMMLAREHRWGSSYRVASMYLRGQLIPLRQLDLVIASMGTEMAFGDAYAQSLSLTRFIVDRMGEDKFWAMLGELENQSFGDAMRAQIGEGPGELWDAWRRSLWRFGLVVAVISGGSLFQVMAVLTVFAYWRKRRRGRRLLREWEEEEQGLTPPPYLRVWEPPYEWEVEEDDDDRR